MQKSGSSSLNIGVRSFLTAICVILALMILTYVLTLTVPGGEYPKITDASGNTIIDTTASFRSVEGGIPFWKWALSPLLVLTAPGSGTLVAVILFLLVIGGVFNALDASGLMQYMLGRTANRFCAVRYRLMAAITAMFMGMGSMIGSFEECVPLVPIVVALSLRLGWDALTGMGMSLLAAGCGFAAGVCNPFTVGVAQQLAGLPMFSGVGMRILAFAVIYLLLMVFLRSHAKSIEQPPRQDDETFCRNEKLDRGLMCFCAIVGSGIVLVLSSGFITVLQDYTMIIVAVMFLAAGISSTLLSGMTANELWSAFCRGVGSIFPAVAMILMASSIRYTLEEAHILDTVLHSAVDLAQTMPRWAVVEFIYLLVLGMNFFIPSGSAKAFMLMPLIVPMAQVFGISPQLCVLAFAFGDGFSNVFYPTNPALLIALGLADVSYGKWFRWSVKFQSMNLLLTAALLLLGLAIGY